MIHDTNNIGQNRHLNHVTCLMHHAELDYSILIKYHKNMKKNILYIITQSEMGGLARHHFLNNIHYAKNGTQY